MTTLRDRFAALLHEDAPLDRLALEIARIGHPSLDTAPSLAELDRLAAGMRPRLRAEMGAEELAAALGEHLGRDAGFTGNRDDYYDPRNSFLNDVLARRLGIPITLGVVFMEVGRRAGIVLEGVGFPGHFLVRVVQPPRPVLLDPFHGGRVVGEPELGTLLSDASGVRRERAIPSTFLARSEPPAILARMLRNLVRAYVDRDEHAAALAAVDLLLVVTPDSPTDVRTRAFLYERLECFAAARDDLRRYLELVPDASDGGEVRARLARLADAAPTLH